MRAPAHLALSMAIFLAPAVPVVADEYYGFKYAFGPAC
jgi:hypothetical protein